MAQANNNMTFELSTASETLLESTEHFLVVFSDQFAYYMGLVNIVGICTFISVFGIISNMINMFIFQRQGFQETVNITLFSISVFDFISLLTTLWVAICNSPLFIAIDVPFLPLEVQTLSGEIPHIMAMNATSWLTAYVTFERCICITFPLKVREMITPRKTLAVVLLIVLMIVAFEIPILWRLRLGWKFDVERNTTLVGLVFTEGEVEISKIAFYEYLVSIFGTILTFVIVVTCSIVLVFKLNQKAKWRLQSIATSEKDEALMSRDQKVIKMILAVAIIFIVSYMPAIVTFAFSAHEPELTPIGKLANNYHVSVSFAFVFEAVNASINIFVYYNMSSKYKAIFHSLFVGKFEKASTSRIS